MSGRCVEWKVRVEFEQSAACLCHNSPKWRGLSALLKKGLWRSGVDFKDLRKRSALCNHRASEWHPVTHFVTHRRKKTHSEVPDIWYLFSLALMSWFPSVTVYPQSLPFPHIYTLIFTITSPCLETNRNIWYAPTWVELKLNSSKTALCWLKYPFICHFWSDFWIQENCSYLHGFTLPTILLQSTVQL